MKDNRISLRLDSADYLALSEFAELIKLTKSEIISIIINIYLKNIFNEEGHVRQSVKEGIAELEQRETGKSVSERESEGGESEGDEYHFSEFFETENGDDFGEN